jgi:hypothetical protein
MRIETGAAEAHPSVLPLDTSATPGVVAATPRYPSGTEQGGVLADISGVDFEADAAAAMAAGMAADADRRGRYLANMQPLGASAGDLMPVSSPPLDPAGPLGEAEPWGATYDPPRGA